MQVLIPSQQYLHPGSIQFFLFIIPFSLFPGFPIMSVSIFLLWLVSFCLTLQGNASPLNGGGNGKNIPPASLGFKLSCGSHKDVESNNIVYKPDDDWITVGERAAIDQPDIWPLLTSVRYFPSPNARKYCYDFPVYKGRRYLVKTLYYYGGFDGGKEPPVFDQIIDATKWSVVNTTEDYVHGLCSYYEVVIMARDKKLSVCLARNTYTKSSPFVSAIEVNPLDDSVYNSTNFNKHALVTVARHIFAYSGEVIGYPDDKFNRYWQPLLHESPVVSSHSNVTPSTFWNLPPGKVFDSAVTASRGDSLKLNWPPFSIPIGLYYIALYFCDNRSPSPYSWRVLDVDINGKRFYGNLNVTTKGVSVYATEWPLGGHTEITLIPKSNMPVGPLINAAEIFQIMPLSKKTITRDVTGMEELLSNIDNPPEDWAGDPCLPRDNSWTGVKCLEDTTVRIYSVNLTGFEISGFLAPGIANLTALQHLWLGHNKLKGQIPDFTNLRSLKTLHLENNHLEGVIPESLGKLQNLQELYLQDNSLIGEIPLSLRNKKDLKIRATLKLR